MKRSFLVLVALVVVACPRPRGTPPSAEQIPTRLLIVVIDQFRADYLERVDLPNLRRLRERSASFDEAYVGHLSSKTVVSHAVLPRGVFPKKIGWSDDSFRDAAGVLGTAGMMRSAEMNVGEMQKFLSPSLPPSVVTAFAAHPRRLFVGEKDYAVAAMAGHEADIDVTLARDGARWKPAGLNVPAYIATDPRFTLDQTPRYGTESSSYALGGDKFVPGATGRGGDVWVADAALALMEHEDWSTLLVTLGGVDKAGHMMGADHDLLAPNASEIHMIDQLRTADAQLGRLLDALERRGLTSGTAIVVTADHGGMWAENFHARGRPEHADDDWKWGRYANGKSFLDPQPEIAALVAGGGIDASHNDTAIHVWTTANDPRAKTVGARLEKMPGVIAVYERAGDRYRVVSEHFDRASVRESAWEAAHARELLDTMAAPNAPDFVALLDEKTGYGVPGDHGGAQEACQRIPLLFAGPNVKPGRYPGRARLVDVAPTLFALTGRIPPTGEDGVPLCAAIRSSPACR